MRGFSFGINYAIKWDNFKQENKLNKINITPNWKTTAQIVIMALQNPNLDSKGFKNAFDIITEMGQKLDLANKYITNLKKEF